MSRKKREVEPTEKSEMAFAVELARGASVARAAKKVRVAESTGYRWARKPEVRHAVDGVRATVLQMASYRMINITGKAIDALEELLGSKNENIRLSAARAVIDGTAKMRQLAELEQELQQIREAVAAIRQYNSHFGLKHA